jgi:hypothetical protein
MHDIDRTLTEFEPEVEEYEGDYEYEDYEVGDSEAVFDEAEEMDLASELLSVSDEAELDQFLGKLIRRAGQAVGRFARSSTGRALGGILKSAARQALPIAGRALGTAFGGPVGGALGGQVAQMAGRAFGLELEGLSPEDQEFEVARRFVRLAGAAASNAAMAPASASPGTAARAAMVAAARRHAPGLVRAVPPTAMGVGFGGRSGRWIRRGRRIVLLGV